MNINTLSVRLTVSFGILNFLLIFAFMSFLYFSSSKAILNSAQNNLNNLTLSLSQYMLDSANIDTTLTSVSLLDSKETQYWLSREVDSFIEQYSIPSTIQIQLIDIHQDVFYQSPYLIPDAKWSDNLILLFSIHASNTTDLVSQITFSIGTGEPQTFTAFLVQPKSAVLEPVSVLQSTQIIFALVLLIIGTGIVFIIAQLFSRPLKEIAKTAEYIAKTGSKQPFVRRSSIREFKYLTDSLTNMMHTIEMQQNRMSQMNELLEQKVLERTAVLNKVNQELRAVSRHDALTGVHNRLAIDEVLKHDFLAFKRNHVPYTVMLLDIDHFKSVNDQHGHAAGDEILKTFGKTLRSCMRETDFVARYGGEEFLIILPDTQEQAFILAEKLRHVVSTLTFSISLKLTVSIGLSIVELDDSEPEDVVRRADQGLYIAKENGRNQSQMI